jgi:gliding motility-associated-like protein
VTRVFDTTAEKIPIRICLNVTDAQNDSLKVYSVQSMGGHFKIDSLSSNNLCFYATPIGSFFGNDSLEVVVADNGYPVMFDALVVHLFVTHVNRPPVFLDGNNNITDTLHFTAFEKEPSQICLSIVDPENDSVVITNINRVLSRGSVAVSQENGRCLDWFSPNIGINQLIVTVCDNGSPSRCDSVTVFIKVLPRLVISQGISPNGDGMDDTWQVGGIERHPGNKVSIFNRWGDLVYKTSGYDNVNIVWKGEVNSGHLSDNIAPDGTYFYIIELEDGSKASGFVVLKH